MTTDPYPFPSHADGLSALSPEILEGLLNNIPLFILVLKPVSQGKDIIDFQYIFSNAPANYHLAEEGNHSGKLFLRDNNGNKKLYALMKTVVTAEGQEEKSSSLVLEEGDHQYLVRCLKLKEFVLLYYEEIEANETAGKSRRPAVSNVTQLPDHLAQQWSLLINNFPGHIARFDKKLRFVFTNDSFLSAIHLPAKEITGKNLLETGIPGEVTVPWLCLVRKVFNTGEVQDIYANYSLNNTETSLVMKLFPEFAPDGSVATVVAIGQDNQELKETRHFADEVTEAIPDLIVVSDISSGKPVYMNRSVISFFGYTEKEFYKLTTQKAIERFVHPEDRERLISLFDNRAQLKAGESIDTELRLLRKDKAWRRIHLCSKIFKYDATGKPLQTISFAQDIDDRKNAEKEALEKAHFISRVTQTVPDIISVIDIHTLDIEYINTSDGDKNEYGNLNAMPKADRTKLVHPDDQKKVDNYFSGFKTATDNDVALLEYRAINTTGEWQWLLARGKVFRRNEKGQVTHCVNVIHNITAAKKAEEKIRQDAHFISHIAETTADILYLMDLDTFEILYTNRQLAIETGYTSQQLALMTNPVLDIIYKEDLPRMLDHLNEVKKLPDGAVAEIEYRVRRADGRLDWYIDRNTVFKRNDKGVSIEKIGIAQKITERKQQEDQNRINLNLLRQLETITQIGTWQYDIATGDFTWSDGMYRLFAIEKGKVVTPDIYLDHAMPGEVNKVAGMVDKIKKDFISFEETISLLTSGDKKKIVRIKAVAIKDKKNKPVKVIGVDLDVTEHVLANELIRDLNSTLTARNRELADLNTELTLFNTVTANDYKETLQVLYTNLEFVARKDAMNFSDTSRANIRRAQSAIQKMKLLTEDINSYLQLYNIKLNIQLIDPNVILEEVTASMNPMIERTQATIRSSEMPRLPADSFLFALLLDQLISNAIKFSKATVAPVIEISYAMADEMNAVAKATRNTPYIILSVSDDGIGFEEEYAEKIFELFYRIDDTNKHRGSGIGLAICKKIMNMHGGFITAEGSPSSGATFNCYFPLFEGGNDQSKDGHNRVNAI